MLPFWGTKKEQDRGSHLMDSEMMDYRRENIWDLQEKHEENTGQRNRRGELSME